MTYANKNGKYLHIPYERTPMSEVLSLESEHEIDGSYQQNAGYEMIPAQRHMKSDSRESDEHDKGDNLLNHFELHQAECTAVSFKPDSVGGHLEAVFEESDTPRQEDDEDKRRGVGEKTGLLQFEMTVPREGHEDIRCD